MFEGFELCSVVGDDDGSEENEKVGDNEGDLVLQNRHADRHVSATPAIAHRFSTFCNTQEHFFFFITPRI